MKPFLQAGARVIARYRARVSDQLGSASLEPVGEGPAALFDEPLALAGLSAAAAVAAGALPEREPHPGAYLAFEALGRARSPTPTSGRPSSCASRRACCRSWASASTSPSAPPPASTDDLVYVSPRTGRAVSRAAGEPYKDRMLALPPFLLSVQSRPGAGRRRRRPGLTAHFLEAFIFNPLNRPLPPARLWLVDRLARGGAALAPALERRVGMRTSAARRSTRAGRPGRQAGPAPCEVFRRD